MKKDIKNNTKKTIINVIFSIMAVVLFCVGVYVLWNAENILPPDPSGEGSKKYVMWFIVNIFIYFPHFAICYFFCWVSVYHLFTARPRALYTTIDVLSTIAFVVPACKYALNFFTNSHYHIDNFEMSLPYVLFLLRLVCWIIYQIADMGPKRPEPTIIPLNDGKSDD